MTRNILTRSTPKVAGQPTGLRDGQRFHTEQQAVWQGQAEGRIQIEHSIDLGGQRRGRIDVRIKTGSALTGVLELKRTDWDAMSQNRVRPNVLRHARQVWRYVEAEIRVGSEVSAGIEYASPPTDAEQRLLIEDALADRGLQVVWTAERR